MKWGSRMAGTGQGRAKGEGLLGGVYLLILINIALGLSPAPSAAYTVYYGNFHSHTAYSDGIGTPQEAYAYARDVANIDVLAITDHTHLLSTSEFNSLITVAAQYTQSGVFVALGAQEFGNLNDFGHLGIYESPYRNPNATDNLLGTYSFMQVVDAFGNFNHPSPSYGTNFDNLAYYPEYADVMTSIEVRNGYRVGDYEPQYIQALNNGWRVGPFADQDNHEGHWGDQQNPAQGNRIYLVGILADSLTRTEIVSALRARRFYAMEIGPPDDRIELDFRVDGHPMGSEVVVGAAPLFTVTAHSFGPTNMFNRVYLFRDGQLYNSQFILGNPISYQFRDGLLDGESHYYFVRVGQVDGDQCWSAPVWITVDVDPAGVEAGAAQGELRLLPNFPNPLSDRTEFRFTLPARRQAVPVHLVIHDPAGRSVRDLGERLLGAGEQSWAWDGRGEEGRPLPAGVYFYRLSAGNTPRSGCLVLIR